MVFDFGVVSFCSEDEESDCYVLIHKDDFEQIAGITQPYCEVRHLAKGVILSKEDLKKYSFYQYYYRYDGKKWWKEDVDYPILNFKGEGFEKIDPEGFSVMSLLPLRKEQITLYKEKVERCFADTLLKKKAAREALKTLSEGQLESLRCLGVRIEKLMEDEF